MEFLQATFKGKTLAENLAFLSTLDVCYAPVNTLPEAFAAAADKLLRDELGRRHLAPPIRFRDEPARPRLREPRLGEHDALKKH
jgi:crotonobetainyl-CoA:carnitine CoA-transferase CaiB-like acyl-CoA transferase